MGTFLAVFTNIFLCSSAFWGYMKYSIQLCCIHIFLTIIDWALLPSPCRFQSIRKLRFWTLTPREVITNVKITQVVLLEAGGVVTISVTTTTINTDVSVVTKMPVWFRLSAAAERLRVRVVAEKTWACAGGTDAESMHSIAGIPPPTVQSGPPSLGSHLIVQLTWEE